MVTQFMFLLRGGAAEWNEYTPEQMQQEMQRYYDWGDQLRREGRYVSAEQLKDGGSTVTMSSDSAVIDGPYTETKDAVGGYYLITAANLAEANEVARGCPIILHGGLVEVREVVE